MFGVIEKFAVVDCWDFVAPGWACDAPVNTSSAIAMPLAVWPPPCVAVTVKDTGNYLLAGGRRPVRQVNGG